MRVSTSTGWTFGWRLEMSSTFAGFIEVLEAFMRIIGIEPEYFMKCYDLFRVFRDAPSVFYCVGSDNEEMC